MNQKGQVVIIMLLIVIVALAIGLSIVGRSTTEISTSNKTEQSSRAFSAAQAGIERALQESNSNPGNNFSSGFSVPSFANQSSASVNFAYNLPNPGQGLEYPPFGKESYAQFWLADPTSMALSYGYQKFYIYFGQAITYTNTEDEPAIEVNVVINSSGKYISTRYYIDSDTTDSNRANVGSASQNNFSQCATRNPAAILTNYSIGATPDRNFLCSALVDLGQSVNSNYYPVMARVRILYSSLSHPVAIYPWVGYNVPAQAKMYTSTGTEGSINRTVQVFQQQNVLPQFLDYALFSANNLSKN